MRTKHWLACLLLAGCGCSTMNNTQADALGGGAAGAVAGGLLSRGSPFGILVGGLLGTGVGAMIGSNQDRADRDQKIVQAQAQAAAAQAARQMSLQEIVQMSQTGVSDGIIIQQINATGSVFALSASDIQYLHDQRVSEQVISVMLSRRYRPPVVVAPGPVYAAPPPGTVVIVDPGPPPPPPIGVGIGVGIR